MDNFSNSKIHMAITDKTLKNFKNLLRFSGIFNIVSAFLLIFPVVYEYYLLFFNDLNLVFGLGGQSVAIPTNPLNALLINTAGIDLVLIGAIVLVISKNPLKNRNIILLNGIGRLIFALIIGYYVFAEDLIRIVVGFGLIDVIISVGFIYYLIKTKNIKEQTT
jgi:ABC-type Fe3+-siderophore transport system permease subunit